MVVFFLLKRSCTVSFNGIVSLCRMRGMSCWDDNIMSSGKKPKKGKAGVAYPSHLFKPEDLLTFIEMKGFASDWSRLGLNDEDLSALQIAIMCAPTKPAVIKDTGGLREIRFAPERWGTGKSGAARVCYAYLQNHGTILLIVAYSK